MQDSTIRPLILRLNTVAFFILWQVLAQSEVLLAGSPMFDEASTPGDGSIGVANAAMLSMRSFGAVRANPAMLAYDKDYQMGAAYHWPSVGREYLQFGVLDSKTSAIAAAAYLNQGTNSDEKLKFDLGSNGSFASSMVKRRMGIGLGSKFDTFQIGVAGHMVEYFDPIDSFVSQSTRSLKRNMSLGVGTVFGITSSIMGGLSAENLGSDKARFVAPTIYRLGFSWSHHPQVTTYFDAHLRQTRSTFGASPAGLALLEDTSSKSSDSQQTLAALASIYSPTELIQLSTGLGVLTQKNEKPGSLASLGVAIGNGSYKMRYDVQRDSSLNANYSHSAQLALQLNW